MVVIQEECFGPKTQVWSCFNEKDNLFNTPLTQEKHCKGMTDPDILRLPKESWIEEFSVLNKAVHAYDN